MKESDSTPPSGLSEGEATVRNETPVAQEGAGNGPERRRIEDILAENPSLRERPEAVLDLIHSEICFRKERGEKPELAEYQKRFPELTEPLRIQWEVDRFLFSGSTSTEERKDGSTPRPRLGRYEIRS